MVGSCSMPAFVSVNEAAEMLGVNRRTVWRLISTGDLPALEDPLDKRAKLIRREDVQRLAQIRRGEVSLTVREFSEGQWTHDLSIQVPRAKTRDEMKRLIQDMVDFHSEVLQSPATLENFTPKELALAQVQSAVDQLED